MYQSQDQDSLAKAEEILKEYKVLEKISDLHQRLMSENKALKKDLESGNLIREQLEQENLKGQEILKELKILYYQMEERDQAKEKEIASLKEKLKGYQENQRQAVDIAVWEVEQGQKEKIQQLEERNARLQEEIRSSRKNSDTEEVQSEIDQLRGRLENLTMRVNQLEIQAQKPQARRLAPLLPNPTIVGNQDQSLFVSPVSPARSPYGFNTVQNRTPSSPHVPGQTQSPKRKILS